MSRESRSDSATSSDVHFLRVAGVVAGALDRLGEEADGGERRPQLVADLRHEVGLELGEVRLAAHEDEHEHDAGDDDRDEADREDPEEEVDAAPRGTSG